MKKAKVTIIQLPLRNWSDDVKRNACFKRFCSFTRQDQFYIFEINISDMDSFENNKSFIQIQQSNTTRSRYSPFKNRCINILRKRSYENWFFLFFFYFFLFFLFFYDIIDDCATFARGEGLNCAGIRMEGFCKKIRLLPLLLQSRRGFSFTTFPWETHTYVDGLPRSTRIA